MKYLKYACLISLLSFTISSYANEEFTFGTVDRFTLGETTIVIDDKTFDLARNAKVYNLKGVSTTRTAIKANQNVKYKSFRPANSRRETLTEIYFLKKD